MPREITPNQGHVGVQASSNQRLDLILNTPSLEILIGGPYTDRGGEEHTYGHAALRTISATSERIYDFGRYAGITGDFGAEGEGILRVWSKFDSYIASENSLTRTTTGFLYKVTASSIQAIDDHFSKLIVGATKRKPKHPNQEEYKLQRNYHGITNNCTTVTLAGAKIALPRIDYNASSNNIGRGLPPAEKLAARAKFFGSWPENIFMPADAQAMLLANQVHKPDKVSTYKLAR